MGIGLQVLVEAEAEVVEAKEGLTYASSVNNKGIGLATVRTKATRGRSA